MHRYFRGRILWILCLTTVLLLIPMSVQAQERTEIAPQYVIVVDQRSIAGYHGEKSLDSRVAEDCSGRQLSAIKDYRIAWTAMIGAIVVLGGASIGLSVKRCGEDMEK